MTADRSDPLDVRPALAPERAALVALLEFDDMRPIERPVSLSTSALDGEWLAPDAPMLLWVFEHIARQALLSWWRQLHLVEDPLQPSSRDGERSPAARPRAS